MLPRLSHLFALLTLSACTGGTEKADADTTNAPTSENPNLVYIITDDLG